MAINSKERSAGLRIGFEHLKGRGVAFLTELYGRTQEAAA